MSSSSKIFCSSGQKVEPQTYEIALNYNTVYGAMNKQCKGPITGTQMGPTRETEYSSEYLYQAVPIHKENPKRIRLTGARALTSDEAMQLVQDRKADKNKCNW